MMRNMLIKKRKRRRKEKEEKEKKKKKHTSSLKLLFSLQKVKYICQRGRKLFSVKQQQQSAGNRDFFIYNCEEGKVLRITQLGKKKKSSK